MFILCLYIGVAELFDISLNDKLLKCNKQYLSFQNEQYLLPNICENDYYDARSADMWSFGMVIHYCFIGEYPYQRTEKQSLMKI